jgi:hypothetical protein
MVVTPTTTDFPLGWLVPPPPFFFSLFPPRARWQRLRPTAMFSSSTDQTSASEKVLQRQKLEDIIGMLLSAGYFRARISTLTPFDKVCTVPVGGGACGLVVLMAGGPDGRRGRTPGLDSV